MRELLKGVAAAFVSLIIFIVVLEVTLQIYTRLFVYYDVEMSRYAVEVKTKSDNPKIGHEHIPATNTPSTVVIFLSLQETLPRPSKPSPISITNPSCTGCTNPIARRTRSTSRVNSEPGTSSRGRRPVSGSGSPNWILTAWTCLT